ncbi:MAG: iron-containing alcohol dehydrogenase [Conexivisphaerales archaeon]
MLKFNCWKIPNGPTVSTLRNTGLNYYSQNFEFSAPVRITYGSGCIDRLPSYLRSVGSKRVLIICGKNFRETPNFDRISRLLNDLLVASFDSVVPHPTLEICESAGKLAREVDADTILSVGGGSSIDTGKAATLLKDGNTDLRDYLVTYDPKEGRKVKQFTGSCYLHVAVPTTFSSAEANGSAAVVESATRRKLILWSDASLPSAVFLDPTLLSTLPRELMAASGMNTFAHGIETIYSSELQPISEALAFGSLELIKEFLPRCVESRDDYEAIGMMQIASVMAGFAYANAVVSLHHAICHVLGAMFNIHHGIANSIMLPYVMKDMVDYVPDSIARIGRRLNIVKKEVDNTTAGLETVRWVEQFRSRIGTPKRLRDVGVPRSKLPVAAEETMKDWVAFQGLRKVESSEEVLRILEAAW